MKHLSDSDISYVMKSIFLLSSWEVVELEDNMRWWIVQSIWRETVQLENKARAKKWEKTLCYQLATLGATPSSKTCDQTKPNQINPNQAKSNQNTDISIDIWEQALVVEHWSENINLMQSFLRQAVWLTAFKDSKERWYVTHCYNLMKKIGKEEFNYRLEAILSDQFKAKNCNKLAYLYWELKSFIHSPVIKTKEKESVMDIVL